MNPRLVLGAKIAFTQNVRRNEERGAIAVDIVGPYQSLRSPASRT
jgi:hypothetical protein